MATRKGAGKGRDTARTAGDVDLTPHPLVAARNVDPSEIEPPEPELSVLVGYIGPSRRDGSIRLYQDLTFHHYYEIPADAVQSTAPVNPDDENSPTRLEVAPETKVEVVSVAVQSVEARYLSGSIAGGFYAAGGGAAAGGQNLCTNITTYMPSCVAQQQPLCTNITTHMPSCVGGQPGAAGAGADCGITMTTRACTFDPTTVRPTTGAPCANITTHMPSCVHCNPNCIATVVTSNVLGAGGGGACITLYTANPSHCATQCDPRCVATVVTSHDPAAFAARAVQPTPPQCFAPYTANPSNCAAACLTVVTANPTDCGGPICLTVVTANPTDCGGPCLTVVTANPTDCSRTVAAAAAPAPAPTPTQYCITLYTANPTNCPVYCVTIGFPTRIHPCIVTHGYPTVCRPPLCIVTRYPTFCHQNPCGIVPTRFPSCDVQVTVTVTVGPGPLGAAAAAAPPPQCITLHTAVPTWCEPCQPIANTAATLCTQNVTAAQAGGTVICPTVYTAMPTGCG